MALARLIANLGEGLNGQESAAAQRLRHRCRRVWGLGFWVLGFGFQGLGFRV